MTDIKQLHFKAVEAKCKYRVGAITREEAKKMIAPFEKAFNEVSIRQAKKYEVKPRLFNFTSFIR